MRWIRVKINDAQRFQMPSLCPNCLCDYADREITILRSFGLPFAFASTTSSSWVFCDRCAKWVTRPRRLQWLFALGPAILLLGAAVASAVLNSNAPSGGGWPTGLFFFAAVSIAIFGTLLVHTLHRLADKPDTCISNYPAVRPIQGGKKFLKNQTYLVVDFAHPIYVEHLVELNPGIIEVNEKKLTKRVAHFERQHLDTQRP